jgi:hypothetical protein
MFRWYKKAELCYVYLADVSGNQASEQDTLPGEFAKSRWFTRGWTLQELLAPSDVIFYSGDWKSLGTKSSLFGLLSEITGINSGALLGQDLEDFSIATRMSWASQRTTTRIEDVAYSLLGIFDVNMPMLYGEGKKAFQRLQEEILRSSSDQSLFAWGATRSPLSMYEFAQVEDERQSSNLGTTSREKNDSKDPEPDQLLSQGLLAGSPADFANSANVFQFGLWGGHQGTPAVAADRGVRIELPVWKDQDGSLSFAVLGCRFDHQYGTFLGIPLRPWGNNTFHERAGELVVIPGTLPEFRDEEFVCKQMKALWVKARTRPLTNLAGCLILRQLPPQESGYGLPEVHCLFSASYDERTRVLRPSEHQSGPQAVLVFSGEGLQSFIVALIRDWSSGMSRHYWACCKATHGDVPYAKRIISSLVADYKVGEIGEARGYTSGRNINLELGQGKKLEVVLETRRVPQLGRAERVAIRILEDWEC